MLSSGIFPERSAVDRDRILERHPEQPRAGVILDVEMQSEVEPPLLHLVRNDAADAGDRRQASSLRIRELDAVLVPDQLVLQMEEETRHGRPIASASAPPP